MHQTQSLKKMN